MKFSILLAFFMLCFSVVLASFDSASASSGVSSSISPSTPSSPSIGSSAVSIGSSNGRLIKNSRLLSKNDNNNRRPDDPVVPVEIYSCSLFPNDFLVEMGSSTQINATCRLNNNRINCPSLSWSSNIGFFSLPLNNNSTAYFSPSEVGNGYIRAQHEGQNRSFACNATVIVVMGPITRLQVSPSFAYLPVGSTQQFSLLAFDDFNNSMVPNALQVNWSSAGNAGTINGQGLFSALEEGNATVVARYREFSANASVLAYLPRSCNLTPSSVNLRAGEEVYLNATCIAGNQTVPCPVLSWSSPLGYFTIPILSNSTARFTATSAGNGTISASNPQGYYCSIPALVLMGNISSISILPQSATLQVGQTQQFFVLARDAFGNNLSTTSANWSSNGSAGTISGSGLFSATSAGTSIVFAQYSGFRANASVLVEAQAAQPSSGSSGGSGNSPGGAMGEVAGINVQKECAGKPLVATVSLWGEKISGAQVSLYLKQGNSLSLVSEGTSGKDGTVSLPTQQEGNYEIVSSMGDLREGRQSFYLSPCSAALQEQPQGASLSPSQPQAELLLRKAVVQGSFVREFGSYKQTNADGTLSYYTDVFVTFTNRAASPILQLEISETVPQSVFSDARRMEFSGTPSFSSAPNTFSWKIAALAPNQNATFAYRIPRALNADMISAFSAPILMLGDQKQLNATVESSKSSDVFASVAASLEGNFGGTSQMLAFAGMSILGLAALFALYTFASGKKQQ